VVDETDHVEGIVSLSDVLHYLVLWPAGKLCLPPAVAVYEKLLISFPVINMFFFINVFHPMYFKL